jgi:hypothetical protein
MEAAILLSVLYGPAINLQFVCPSFKDKAEGFISEIIKILTPLSALRIEVCHMYHQAIFIDTIREYTRDMALPDSSICCSIT